MKREAVIQVQRQLPEIQQLLLQRCQGNDVGKRLPCPLDDHQADSLERLQQQFRTWVLGLSARLAWIQLGFCKASRFSVLGTSVSRSGEAKMGDHSVETPGAVRDPLDGPRQRRAQG